MNERYILVLWPETQELMGERWFEREAILVTEEKFGSSAYFIPEKRIKGVEILSKYIELASKFAHDRTFHESSDIINNEDEMYTKENPLKYTKEIQNRFDQWYDYYLSYTIKILRDEQ